jgi:hypothetical protein
VAAEPSSWFVLEPGHDVVTADGKELGKVKEVLGDTVHDIFDGLLVSTGALGLEQKYVPAELVESIDTEAVRLTVSADETGQLDEVRPPGAVARKR